MSFATGGGPSYVRGASDVALIVSTIGDLFDRVAERAPNHEALVSCHQGLRYTYKTLQEECNRFGRGLMACGVEKGNRLGIWSPNYAEWVITQYAAAKIGAILVNINPAYRIHELEYALQQSGCATLIILAQSASTDYLAVLQEICPELTSSQPGRLSSVRLPQLRTVIMMGDEPSPGVFSWGNILAKGDQTPMQALKERQSSLECSEPINIQYTSGTTGFPKGATLSHHSILNNGFFVGERMRFTPEDRLALPVSLYHCFGMVCGSLACVTHGATLVLPSESFDPFMTLQAVEDEGCTALLGVPTMFIAELAVPGIEELDLSTLRTGSMGGAPCPIEIIKQVTTQMHMTEITIVYGMTETSPITFQTVIDDELEKRFTTVGRIHAHIESKIVGSETGVIVPRGVVGELLVRGYAVMLGYWNNPEETARTIDSDGWLHTGDLAKMDGDGYVNIAGRSKDMIIRGGENISPREVEEFLYKHPAVQDVQVVGVPDMLYGERVMAWIILKPGHRASADELREFCQEQIAQYKIPRFWRFTDRFPMTLSGKVQKYKLRDIAIQELGLEGEAAIETA